jgi:acetyl-CoA carboxylase carboxyl transferase alpha subunit/acetyl-CoA carboxylase carboxyl transferase beta subunit
MTPGDAPAWALCPQCRQLVYGRKLAASLHVCPVCGRHNALTARQRIDQLLDPGTAVPLDLPVLTADPLGFIDSLPYPERLREARARTGLPEAMLCATGEIERHPVVIAVMDFRFLGGSLGAAVGELVVGAARTALERHHPLLIVTSSGGARMQEGAIALMQMAKTSVALRQLDEGGVLTIALITDPTFGGVAASFATLCDVIIAEPGARLGFAGPRVIRQTIGQQLPPGFQTAEFLAKRGLIDLVRPRAELRGALGRLLTAGCGRGLRPAAMPLPDPVVRDVADTPGRDAWAAVRRARALTRPTTLDYAGQFLDGFQELHGDRMSADCPAIVGGVGQLAGVPVMLIGQQKGHTLGELTARRFGMASPAGYRKAARLMRLAAKLGLPVVTLIDTPGAFPGMEAEESGQAVAIAENLRLMIGLPVPIIAIVTGEGGSGGALALAIADEVLMSENAVYSVISPEGCAAILWKDPAAAPLAASALRLDAQGLLGLGIIDGIVPEPEGGAVATDDRAARNLGASIAAALRRLMPVDAAELVARRHARFLTFGRQAAVRAPQAAGHR